MESVQKFSHLLSMDISLCASISKKIERMLEQLIFNPSSFIVQ